MLRDLSATSLDVDTVSAQARKKKTLHDGSVFYAVRDCVRDYFATGIVNSAPLAMLSGQRCITLL
jgi:hypothetical protein